MAGRRAGNVEAALYRRAFREQWSIPKKLKKKVLSTLEAKLDSEDDRTAVGAARAIIFANGQNIEQERIDAGIDQPTVNVFLGKLDVLADDPRVIELNEEIIARLDRPADDGPGQPVGTGDSDQSAIPEADSRAPTVGGLGPGSDDIGLDHPDHLPPAARQE